MSGRFTVDPASLHGLAQTMRSLTEKVDDARTRTRAIDGSDVGSSDLAGAVSRFTDHWGYQAGQISTTLREVSTRLDQAADQYQQVENAQLRLQKGTA